ncbi:hypothetical protein [Oscillibacter valericigenes]|uniref:hypothetical protein n=1 Tax=Oscillibacter valericigenes TaxID=351091 RepID=UPI00195B56B3|nr:hypothetical protein [Oscillibacter valericigenes]MBM6910413.1 hypothetical protein [Oscillibacter valericigenes]
MIDEPHIKGLPHHAVRRSLLVENYDVLISILIGFDLVSVTAHIDIAEITGIDFLGLLFPVTLLICDLNISDIVWISQITVICQSLFNPIPLQQISSSGFFIKRPFRVYTIIRINKMCLHRLLFRDFCIGININTIIMQQLQQGSLRHTVIDNTVSVNPSAFDVRFFKFRAEVDGELGNVFLIHAVSPTKTETICGKIVLRNHPLSNIYRLDIKVASDLIC